MSLLNNKQKHHQWICWISEKILHAEAEQKLLCIIIDKDLNFHSHTKSVIRTANQKLSALSESHRLWLILTKITPFLKDSLIIVPYSGCLALEK